MLAGAPEEARWMRPEPRRNLPAPVLQRMLETALPGRRVLTAQPLPGGFRNTNLKLHLDGAPERIVLRVYEHDPSLCQKEVDLIRLIGGSVPVPELIHAEPRGFPDQPPFTLARYIEGTSFRALSRQGDIEAIAQAAWSAGEALAAIGRFQFAKPGWLGPGPAVGAPLLEGADALPRFVDLCLASKYAARRVPADLRQRTHALVWAWAPRLAGLDDERSLVHGDFGKRNLLVRQSAGRWRVAAIVDWEFAVSGSPLADVGNFLRYERPSRPLAEPHFSAGYLKAGGQLPEDWRSVARVVDLAALCECLTHEHLPNEAAAELAGLVRGTVEDLAVAQKGTA